MKFLNDFNCTARLCGLIFLFFSLWASTAHTQFNVDMVIQQSRGKRAIFSLGVERIQVGDILIALDEAERRKGVLKVIKVGRTKGLAQILKGRALEGWFVEKYIAKSKKRTRSRPRPRPRQQQNQFGDDLNDEPAYSENDRDNSFQSSPQDSQDDNQDSSPNKRTYHVGLLFAQNKYSLTADVEQENGDIISSAMSASALSYHLFLRTKLYKNFDIIATLGNETYEATESSESGACSDTTACFTNISYLTVNAMAAYNFKNSFNPWVGGGIGILKPGSAESNAIEPESVTTTMVFLVGAGIQYKINSKWSVPALLKYTYFPPSEGVATSILSFGGGVAYSF